MKLTINRYDIDRWKADTIRSVRMYNDWFLNFAPATYICERRKAMETVGEAIKNTANFQLTQEQLIKNPEIITTLRMATIPPIATARLIGFADVRSSLLKSLEHGKIPAKIDKNELDASLGRIIHVIKKLLDYETFPWIKESREPTHDELIVAKSIIADRLCGTLADPIIRNEQERRQLRTISTYLTLQGYKYVESNEIKSFENMENGTFGFHVNVPVYSGNHRINMPIDVVIKRKDGKFGSLPLLVECKSAGDYTNTNKRRKEEGQKILQLEMTYGADNINFVLFLCGYFDTGYLGYEASEHIDWIWEHRISDFKKAGI